MSTEAVVVESKPGIEKVNLLGLSQKKLEAFFETLGEKRFRATQVLKWIHQMGVDDFHEMTNISQKLRNRP